VDTGSRKPCRIAQQEIEAGKVGYVIGPLKTAKDSVSELLDNAISRR
jgi:DNA-directed RNA polymerase subunit K/omega